VWGSAPGLLGSRAGAVLNTTWLFTRWNAIRASYWFVPSLMAVLAAGLAFGALRLDAEVAEWEAGWLDWVYTGGPSGARALLSTVAGSMIGTAGVTFSVTIVALAQASSQFGPRLLRNFMRDTGNQMVLGAFVATFVYCLLVLREVSELEGAGAVPAFATSLGVVLAVASLGSLIFFFHHVASSIQADHVVAAVARDLQRSIDHFCGGWGAGGGRASTRDPEHAPPPALAGGHTVCADRSGYVQAVEYDTLFELACSRGLVMQLLRRAGHFVRPGEPLARVARLDGDGPDGGGPAGDRGEEDGSDAGIRQAFLVGAMRTEDQDVEYAIRQLVEVALRALSPSVQDPFTAINCIDWLGAALVRFLDRGAPARVAVDAEGRARLFTQAPGFPDLVAAAFDQVRQAAHDDVAVSLRLLETLAPLARAARSPADQAALERQMRGVLEGFEAACSTASDLQALRERQVAALVALGRSGAPEAPVHAAAPPRR